MSVVQTVNTLMDWLKAEVCPKVTLKAPPDNSTNPAMQQSADGYDYRLVHPAVLGMYWPADRAQLPPQVETTHPGIMVQVLDGEEDAASMRQTLHIRLHLGVWNPGIHGRDVWHPSEVGFVRGEDRDFAPRYDECWQDAWNFMDTLLRELRTHAAYGEGVAPVRGESITFGPYSEQGAILDLYPYWFSWVDVAVQQATAENIDYQEFL